jgi:hypothetical protein
MSTWATTNISIDESQELTRWGIDYTSPNYPGTNYVNQISSSYQNATTSVGSTTYSFHSFSFPPVLASFSNYPDPEAGDIIQTDNSITNPSYCEPCEDLGGIAVLSNFPAWKENIISSTPDGFCDAIFKFRVRWRKSNNGPGQTFFDSSMLEETRSFPLKKDIVERTRTLTGNCSCICVYPE